jgi:acyl carrier protein
MERNEIIQQLKTIIEPYVQDQEAFQNISENTDLLNDLKVNSANLVDIIIDAEMAFDIEIDDDSAEKMLTVKDAVEIIEQLTHDR